MQPLQLPQQHPGVGLGKSLTAGDAGMEQQGGVGGAETGVQHQASLLPQPPQPGLTGPARSRQAAQIPIAERAQRRPGIQPAGGQLALFSLEMARWSEGLRRHGSRATCPLIRSRSASARTTGRALSAASGSIPRSRTRTRPSTAVRPPPRRLLATWSTVGP